MKGIRDTIGFQTRYGTGDRAHRGKLMVKLTRLEHQRALLARQLSVWTEKQQLTRERLSRVETEIGDVEGLLHYAAASRRPARGKPGAAARTGADRAVKPTPGAEMDLEY